jgi:hypothetical protein
MDHERDIKDYLHLYLGCDMQYNTHHEPQNEPYILTAKNLDEAIEFEERPILRPLSDITDEEIRELFRHDKISKEYSNVSYQRELVMNNILMGITVNYDVTTPDGTYSHSWTLRFSAINAHDFKWLLSKHFDLFQLIDAGLAISKTK